MCKRLMMTPLQSTTMGCRDIKLNRKNKKSERGSITLEAAIFLTLFILFYVAMMDLIQIAKAQVILQYSINETAKKVSAYSYVLTKAGITRKRVETSGKAVEVDKVIDQIEHIGTSLTNGDLEGAINEADAVAGKLESTDVEELTDDLLSWFKTKVTDKVDDIVLEEMVQSEVKKQIDMMSAKGADRFLRDLGIDEGLEGLSFEGSSWANASESVGGLPVLTVKVTYTINFHLGYLELQPRTYTLCAKTAIW